MLLHYKGLLHLHHLYQEDHRDYHPTERKKRKKKRKKIKKMSWVFVFVFVFVFVLNYFTNPNPIVIMVILSQRSKLPHVVPTKAPNVPNLPSFSNQRPKNKKKKRLTFLAKKKRKSLKRGANMKRRPKYRRKFTKKEMIPYF